MLLIKEFDNKIAHDGTMIRCTVNGKEYVVNRKGVFPGEVDEKFLHIMTPLPEDDAPIYTLSLLAHLRVRAKGSVYS